MFSVVQRIKLPALAKNSSVLRVIFLYLCSACIRKRLLNINIIDT